MAEVAKIDIDGVQWDIKDQNARNKIVTLEEKTTIKITKKIDTESIKMNLVEINGELFVQLHIQKYIWNGVIGDIIGKFTNDFGIVHIIRATAALDPSDSSGRVTGGIDIRSDGTMRLYPHTESQWSGAYKECKVFCDAFIRVNY